MSFCKCKSYSQWNSNHAIFNDQSFNNMLVNDIVRFEQLGPEKLSLIVDEVMKTMVIVHMHTLDYVITCRR